MKRICRIAGLLFIASLFLWAAYMVASDCFPTRYKVGKGQVVNPLYWPGQTVLYRGIDSAYVWKKCVIHYVKIKLTLSDDGYKQRITYWMVDAHTFETCFGSQNQIKPKE